MTFGARSSPFPKPQLHGQHLCAVCLGYSNWEQCTGPKTGRHVFHCAGCKPAVKRFADMSDTERRKMRTDGLYQASQAIGDYLDRKGKTDFATMSEREWYDFLHEVLNQYEIAIRDITRRWH